MQPPQETIKQLKNRCAKCGEKLFAYRQTPIREFPEIGAWYIECENTHCDYTYPDCFITIEGLAEQFQVEH